MMDEVGINVDGCGDQRILEISLEELRSDLAGFHSTVFQQQAKGINVWRGHIVGIHISSFRVFENPCMVLLQIICLNSHIGWECVTFLAAKNKIVVYNTTSAFLPILLIKY